ncbi:tRNA threonylcarbamoyl adenosine modification protein, Sua5/YciO/YrdC/YwlC family [Chitinophaga terrae (ex Kim and Jung 2007)]|jgi:tRNA threonylcarbamoyl adenosine modification protein (Sua5/YciO/YrdC/YwlC family)|uniref:tRNA threonylcarbamoyl adenosine modification protein, Sua5/YciO/YrdC/YwlC family n=1 Tax=Chitinophaga terrae (ex Kim and Jung 2007) TaxID=408074 RepID=A0A1H4E9S6_9BACT|nr:L-threonylcarbamoyladenylate synthase [Chitinophaga terrae (ex Kim and Jung 2007)]MDQ0105429.1 tRNA threonylcarbamoyl adenosine modification protein (Sua5/YciO/YrdC/YwlC family) [Chitinophaga terrae (ex Kim and Jung 2007)]GEP91472.1 threonylcarbamoyl-AMP synthase [Chitinophaga terrae (ex Kim and Jung 2007)]SEA81559.1 tRNA threonylcarbamoyl adenosine modification protein, Sua5/YciO/YrdC/YwlC family [Chitinophaga terrae (ex Kim and Jung 2007)]
MLLQVHPDNPNARNIKTIVECLQDGGIIIYPTDTVYGLGCDITQPKAIERIARIKHIDPKKANFSFICYDLSHLSDYAKSVDTPVFRMLKKALPGPYTFILPASRQVPRLLKTKKDTVGIRVPNNNICRTIVKELGNPIMSTTLPIEHYVEEYTDPEIIYEKFGKQVDIVVDGGPGGMAFSTVIDCTGPVPELVREGIGSFEAIS